MTQLFGRDFTRQEIEQRIGDISQIGGVRLGELADGPGRGIRTAEFRTGSGFNFTVLLDRGMDISQADFCGRSLCWRSSTGDVSPAFYQPEGLEWLYGFFGGLLTTCGLTYHGAPCEDEGKSLGLHGRVSNIPAREVAVESKWTDDDQYLISLTGKVIETYVFGPVLCLTRTIRAFLGESRLFIHDAVQNIGHEPAPHMILYHINIGWPALDEGAELLAPSKTVIPRDAEAENGKERYNRFDPPTAGYREKVYYHLLAGRDGATCAAVVNRRLGFGAYVRFDLRQLPLLIEWKMMGRGVYTCGIEPSTHRPEGRARERREGKLILLEPGEIREYDLEIGALSDPKSISDFDREVRRLTRGKSAVFAQNR